MKFDDLPFEEWTRYPFKLAWGEGDKDQEREFFTNKGLMYKLWSSQYVIKDLYVSNGEYHKWDYADRSKSIASLDSGFINKEISPALVDLIWKGNFCVGYITTIGKKIDIIPDAFYKKILEQSIATGYLYMDFCSKNICENGGVYSLIDYDTPLTRLSTLNLDFERKSGVLRKHIDLRYRRDVLELAQRGRE